ncbi:neutral/alkaline non-lysosomal ceramidase N-terminal domain-containing protein [Myxococcaceae bacterium GXIMD 01537]
MRLLHLCLALVLALAACEHAGGGPRLPDDGSGGTGVDVVTPGACAGQSTFLVGSGIYDITGPAAEVGMMGYAQVDQTTAGIHQRLRSRAFVIASPCNGKRVVFVSADLGMVFQAVKLRVVERLRARYGDLYSADNVLLSATHTHSGPGGFSHYTLYNLTTFGFVPQNFDAIAEGIVESIVRAHDDAAAGSVRIASGELLDANRNRSPRAYAANPAAERERYGRDTDSRMTLLRLTHADGTDIGVIDWFAVHATSMGNKNHLISGDNKGYASYLFEKEMGARYLRPGKTFVAAFANSNEGDVTPNLCGGTDGCGGNDFGDTALAARKQQTFARALFASATRPLTGGVDYRHAYVKMDAVDVAPAFGGGQARRTCPAAIGASMLAGAEDGPGFGSEGLTCQNVRDLFGQFLCGQATTPCQGEKPIVLEMGTQSPPWSPEVLPLQIVRIGELALVAVPFELTTMSGRRLRETVREALAPAGVTDVVIAGLANAYSGYVATREEYALQHYEGASTHFGPWTLAALQQEFDRLGRALATGAAVPPGPSPRDLSRAVVGLQPGVVYDDKWLWVSFGGVVQGQDAKASYLRGETARATFWAGHPRNDLRTQGSFLRVQRQGPGGQWTDVAYDWDWDTVFRWERVNCFPTFGCSNATVEWTIPLDAPPGTYRLVHQGHWKSGWDGKARPYSGASRAFTVK